MMICRRAARFIPPMIATGAARINGQGVATTRIASTRIESCVANQTPAHAAMVAGVNHTAYLSASRWSGALLDCAVRTSSTMRAYWLSDASADARSRSTPMPFSVPLITSVPGAASTGVASPVSAATVRSEYPSTTSPSQGTRSPGRTSRRSPTTISPTGMSSTRSPAMRCAIRGAASSSARTAADARPSAQCSSASPPVCISTMTSPASGCIKTTAPMIASDATMSVAKCPRRAALETLRVNLVDRFGAGGPGGEPAVRRGDLHSADRRVVSRSSDDDALHRFARQFGAVHVARRERRKSTFLCRGGGCLHTIEHRLAPLLREGGVELARVASGDGRDLRGEQRGGDAVLVGRPHGPVAAHERRTRALFAAKAERTVRETADEPLESDRHFAKPAPELRAHPVDHAGAHHRLAHSRVGAPPGTVPEQVVDGNREVMVRWQQPRAARHDAVAIVVRIAGERDVKPVLELDQPPHRPWGRWVGAYAAVPIERHETEGRIDDVAHHGEIYLVSLRDRRPVVDARASERIDAQVKARGANPLHVHHVGQVAHVRIEKVVPVRRCCTQRALVRNALHAGERRMQQLVGPPFDPARDLLLRRSAGGRIVFEPAVFGGIVRWRDHDAVGEAGRAPRVVAHDGVRYRWCGCEFVMFGHHHLHAVSREHLERAGTSRSGKRVRVEAEEERSIDPPAPAIAAYRLADRQHVPLVEGSVERPTAMTGGTERHLLRWHRRVGRVGEVRRDQLGHVEQHRGRSGVARERADLHWSPMTTRTEWDPPSSASVMPARASTATPSTSSAATPRQRPPGFSTEIS